MGDFFFQYNSMGTLGLGRVQKLGGKVAFSREKPRGVVPVLLSRQIERVLSGESGESLGLSRFPALWDL